MGLILNLVTGVLLFVKNATTWGTALPFLVKMGLVIASVAMLVPIRKYVFKRRGDQRVDSRARLLAIASILAWSGAVTAGRLLAYLVPYMMSLFVLNAAHLHLILNHVPRSAPPSPWVSCSWPSSVVTRSCSMSGLEVLFVIALVTVPVYVTGVAAYQKMRSGPEFSDSTRGRTRTRHSPDSP